MNSCTTQNTGLKTLHELFSGENFYRIPDYQRGFSWNKEFKELWKDIIRLLRLNNYERKHYVGMLALDKITGEIDLKNEALSNTNAYYIVDGQQRITSLVIIINGILHYAKNWNIAPSTTDLQELLKTADDVRKFGYSSNRKDNADDYFEKRIYENCKNEPHPSQYLSNINQAAEYIENQLDCYEEDEICEILNIILNRLIFNTYYISEDFDVRVTFETMNNRGKPLTNLELLKNRLMYLSTFFPKTGTHNYSEQLQKQINTTWKNIYDNLNYNDSKLSDDVYLKAHWIVYKRLNKNKGNSFIEDILEYEFAADEGTFYELCCKKHDYRNAFDLLKNYVKNLDFLSRYWAMVNIPGQNILKVSNTELDWLKRLSRMPDILFVKAALMVVLAKQTVDGEPARIKFYKMLEQNIFINRLIGQNTNDMSFLVTASRELLYAEEREDQNNALKNLIKTLQTHKELELTKENVQNALEQFSIKISDNGYYSWNGLKYFLYEYNESLDIPGAKKIEWYKPSDVSIEHILPQEPNRKYWETAFRKHFEDEEQKWRIINTLGNLLLLSNGTENSSLKNYSYPVKRELSINSKKFAYRYGSHSAIEIAENEHWTIKEIHDRTMKLLLFMYENWFEGILTEKEWKDIVTGKNLINFDYTVPADTEYEALKAELDAIDVSDERASIEKLDADKQTDDFLSKQLLRYFPKDIFKLHQNPKNISYKDYFTYVITLNSNGEPEYFRCGILLDNIRFVIEYFYNTNIIKVYDRNNPDYFPNIEALPELLQQFVKAFSRYIKRNGYAKSNPVFEV